MSVNIATCRLDCKKLPRARKNLQFTTTIFSVVYFRVSPFPVITSMNSALMFSHYGFYCFNLSLLSLSFSHNRITFYVFSCFFFISGFDLCLLFYNKLKTKEPFCSSLDFLNGTMARDFQTEKVFFIDHHLHIKV